MTKTKKINRFEVPRDVVLAAAARGYSNPGSPIEGLTPLIPGMGRLSEREMRQLQMEELKATRRARLLVEAADTQDRIESGESIGVSRVENRIRGALGRIGLAEVIPPEEIAIVRDIGQVQPMSGLDTSPIVFVDTEPKQ